jgi:hypothetical protein
LGASSSKHSSMHVCSDGQQATSPAGQSGQPVYPASLSLSAFLCCLLTVLSTPPPPPPPSFGLVLRSSTAHSDRTPPPLKTHILLLLLLQAMARPRRPLCCVTLLGVGRRPLRRCTGRWQHRCLSQAAAESCYR